MAPRFFSPELDESLDSLFEERGIFDAPSGKAFLHSILEMGGSRDAMDNFLEFRGREPSIEPLLRHSGIAV